MGGIMGEAQAISQTTSVQHYKMQSTPRPMKSQGAVLLDNPPVVAPEEFPTTTMCRIFKVSQHDLKNYPDYEDMRAYLMAFQRGGDSRRWDEFRNKISPALLSKLGDIMNECRRNGFINPTATLDGIEWMQIISTSDRAGEPFKIGGQNG